MKEKISELLQEQFSSVYCDTCADSGLRERCDMCNRKSMQWSLSESAANQIADEILEVLK
jgi:hypothetical protein